MAQIVAYREQQRLAPVAGEKQRAVSAGFGQEIGQGLQRVATGVERLSDGLETLRQKEDEAAVLELDAEFSEQARELQSAYLSSRGRAAIDTHEQTLTTWDQRQEEFLSRATSDRQRQLLGRVLGQRREQFIGQADRHRIGQTDAYLDASEQARIGQLGNDVISTPDGPDREVMLSAHEQAVRARAQRLGLDGDAANMMVLEAQTVVHQNAVGAMLEAGDPVGARAYIETYADQIGARVRTQLDGVVREQLYDYRAQQFWDADPVDRPDPVETVEVDGQRQSLALAPPVPAAMGSRFGPRRSPGGQGSTNHRGVDYPVPVGTPVTASLPGVIRWRDDPDGYGRYAVIDHGGGLETRYAHLSAASIADGTRVEQGQVIGLSGGARGSAGAGNSQGPHVHYEVRRNGQAVDPASVVGQRVEVEAGVDAGAMPTTVDDVMARAAEAAGDDWRYRAHLERTGMARLSQTRQARADREGEASRALDQWLVDNPQAADQSQIPASIWNSVSPAERLSVQGTLRARASGESGIDPVVANDTYNLLVDEAVANPGQFLQRDMRAYRGVVTEGQLNSLLSTYRSLATQEPGASEALRNRRGLITSYARAVGIETGEDAAPEDAERMAYLDLSIQQFADGYRQREGREPDLDALNGALRTLTAPANNGRAYFEGASSGFRIPRGDRAVILRELRTGRNPVANPTEEQIQRVYALGIAAGRFRPTPSR